MKDSVEKSILLLEFVINQAQKTSTYLGKRNHENVSLFCLCMIERLQSSSIGLKILLKESLNNLLVEYSCGIILRAFFLDFVILLNAYEITNNERDDSLDDLNEFCSATLADNVRHTLKDIKYLYSQAPEETRKNIYSNLVSSNSACFETYNNDGTPPILKETKTYQIKEMVRNLYDSTDLNKYNGIYEAYLYYSKYDHFGQVFYHTSRESDKQRLDFVNKSVTYIPRAFLFAQSLLLMGLQQDAFLLEQYKEVTSFINTECGNAT